MSGTKIVFPSICADLGGAEWVWYNSRTVRVKLPGHIDAVTFRRSELPDPSHWTAFNLAERATSNPVGGAS